MVGHRNRSERLEISDPEVSEIEQSIQKHPSKSLTSASTNM